MNGFGDRLRWARERAGLSQERLAQLAGLERTWVRRLESGHEPRLSAAINLYAALAPLVPGLHFDWFLTGWGNAGRVPDVNRRAALRLAAVVLPASVPMPALDTARLASPAALDIGLMDGLEVLTEQLGLLRPTISPRELLPMLDAHLAALRARFDARAPGPLKRRLFALATDAANLAAWSSLALERRTDARDYLTWSEDVARQSGDAEGLVLALHLGSDLASPIPSGGQDGHGPTARRRIEEARSIAGPELAGPLRASLLLHSAEEHAFVGEEVAALRDLDAAEQALGRGARPYGRPHASLDAATVAGYRGSVAQMLGRPREAIAVMGPAIAPARAPRARAVALTELAAAHAQLREIDQACALLGEAVDIVSGRGDLERGRRIAAVRRRHLIGVDDEPCVRDLDERLAAIL